MKHKLILWGLLGVAVGIVFVSTLSTFATWSPWGKVNSLAGGT